VCSKTDHTASLIWRMAKKQNNKEKLKTKIE